MKKFLAASLAALMSVSLVGCKKNITYTIPASYITYEEEDQTLDNFVQSETDSGKYTTVTANDDGSVTYVVTEDQHEALLTDFKAEIDKTITEVVDSSDIAITTVNYTEDMSEFNIYVDEENATGLEAFYALYFCIYGNYYQYMNGGSTDTTDTTVNLVDAVSEETVETIKASDIEAFMNELEEAVATPTPSASAAAE